jgi:predicted aldo/keto reductase-like oxidoreductase
MEHQRRQFIHGATAIVAGAAVKGLAGQAEAAQAPAAPATTPGPGVPTRTLGRTGQKVSMLSLGGWHIGAVKEKSDALSIMQRAVDEGLTFFDNCWDYHQGKSEEWMGEALAAQGPGGVRRKQVFLMTKNCERDYEGSKKCLEDSLRRLRTDYLDLWQFHEMIYDNDPDWVFEKGGIKAALEAKKAGKVRFIGFTGHKHPDIHLKMLAMPQQWDTVQMPVNAMDGFYRSFQKQVLPVARRKGAAVLGMKSLGGGGPPEGIILQRRKDLTADELIGYALSQPIASLVVGITSMKDLEQDLRIARDWKPMSAGDQQKLLAKVRVEATDGRHELFKSSQDFDGPHHRKQHGFSV